MRHVSFPVFLLLPLALAGGSALAQNTSQNPAQPNESVREQLSQPEQTGTPSKAAGRLNQTSERILVEDAGSRIDELRVGGQTQSITVQPKVGNLPEYEVQPSDGVRNREAARSAAPSKGSISSGAVPVTSSAMALTVKSRRARSSTTSVEKVTSGLRLSLR